MKEPMRHKQMNVVKEQLVQDDRFVHILRIESLVQDAKNRPFEKGLISKELYDRLYNLFFYI